MTPEEINDYMQGRILLIDADSIPYIIGWSMKDKAGPDDYMMVVEATDQFMRDMLKNTGCSKFIGFLGGVHPTFRHLLVNTYKSKRGLTKPEWYMHWGSIVSHRLKHKWNFYYLEGIEAEDGVGIMANHIGHNKVVIAHIDKDLNQIPGLHYNFDKQSKYLVNYHEAIYNYYKQVIMGDPVDDVIGVPRIGPKKAEKLLLPGSIHSNPQLAITAWEMAAETAYTNYFGEEEGMKKFLEGKILVKILDTPISVGFTVESYTPFEYIVEQTLPVENIIPPDLEDPSGLKKQVENYFS